MLSEPLLPRSPMFELSHHFIAAYADHYVASRRAAARRWRYGRPGPLPAMISASAGALRRLAAALDAWAAGSPRELPDLLPRGPRSAH